MNGDAPFEPIFLRAIEIHDAHEREAYLAQACGDNAQLRAKVDQLISAHLAAGSFLDQPAVGFPADSGATQSVDSQAAAHSAAAGIGPGTQVGPYKILQQLGEGGMGVVYLAEQTDPVRRRVALKIIKAGMDSRQAVARFEVERQALALMDHPHIARVFDAGPTASGRPYFAMELVQGVPITEYCDHQQLTPRERLELFVPVCHAIQHAHQKGIIHRDIKPTNVLITLVDDRPVPKVIDFGVAKATQQRLTERTMFTETGQIIGTLEYMSPEQAETKPLDVDTRSDVYSLGALLHKLLTGTTPITKEQLREAGYAEMLQTIREVEPPKPSLRLSDSGDALPSISAVRKTDPSKISRLIAGDLDWIVMKALEKDRRRRYGTANGLAEDIGRYLRDEAIEARPPAVGYQIRKFARRHKASLFTSALLASAILVGSAVSIWQAVRASQQAELANDAAQLAAQEAGRAQESAEREAEARQQEQVERERAQLAQQEAEKRLGSLYVANGRRHSDNGDLLTSLLWFAEALKLESGDESRETVHRVRLAATLRKCPILSAVWSFNNGVQRLEYSPDGRYLAMIVSTSPRVWDLATRRPVSLALDEKEFKCTHLQFSSDGKHLTAAGFGPVKGNLVQIRYVTDEGQFVQEEKRSIAPPGKSQRLVLSPDGRYLLLPWSPGPGNASAKGGSVIRVLDLKSGETNSKLIKIDEHLTHASFAPDGKTFVAVKYRSPPQVSLWDTKTCKLRHLPLTLSNSGEAHFATISPDNTLLVAVGGGYDEGVCRVWDIESAQPVFPPFRTRRQASCAAFSPDSRLVAVGTGNSTDVQGDYEAWLIDARTGMPVIPPMRHASAVRSVEFSPDGKALLTTTIAGTARVWDLSTGEPSTPPLPAGSRLNHATFSPDGGQIAMSGIGRFKATVRLWDLSATTQPTISNIPFSDVAISPNGQQLLSFRGTGWSSDESKDRIQLIDLTGDASRPMPLHDDGHGYHAAFSDDGRFCATGTGSPPSIDSQQGDRGPLQGAARVWNAENSQPVTEPLLHDAPVAFVALSPDGKFLFTVTGSNPLRNREFWIWDVENEEPIVAREQLRHFNDARFTSDSKRVVISQMDSTRIYDLQSKSPIRAQTSFRSGEGSGGSVAARRIAMSPEGTRALICVGGSQAQFIDVRTGDHAGPEIRHGRRIQHVTFSANGELVLTVSDNSVRLWDAATRQPIAAPLMHDAKVESAEFVMNDQIVLTASRDGTVRVWDAATGEQVTPPLQHSSFVQQARISEDGKRLLAQVHSRIHSWDFSPMDWSVEDVTRWAELMAGKRIDAAGGIVSLESGAAQQLEPAARGVQPSQPRVRDDQGSFDEEWLAIYTKHGRFFAPSPGTRDSGESVAIPSDATPEIAEQLIKRGRKLLERNDTSEALQNLRIARDTWREVLQSHPDDKAHQRGLASAHFWLGRALAKQQDLAAAERQYSAALQLNKELCEKNSSDRQAQQELARCFVGLGWVSRAFANWNEAENYLTQGLNIFRALDDANADRAFYDQYLNAIRNLRWLCVEQGDTEGERLAHIKELEVYARLAVKGTDDASIRARLWRDYLELARDAYYLDRDEDAEKQLDAALFWLDAYAKIAASKRSERGRALTSYRETAISLLEMKETGRAATTLHKAVELWKSVLPADPSSDSHFKLACLYSLLSTCAEQNSRAKYQDSAFEHLKLALERRPADARWNVEDNDLAAIHDDPRYERLLKRVRRLELARHRRNTYYQDGGVEWLHESSSAQSAPSEDRGPSIVPRPGVSESADGSLPTRILRGRIVDEMSMPLAGVGVIVAPADRITTRAALDEPTVTSGEDGRFELRFTPQPESRYDPHELLIAAPSRTAVIGSHSTLQFQFRQDATATDPIDVGTVTLAEGTSFEGHVRGAGGRPIAGARVRAIDLLSAGPYAEHAFATQAMSDANGKFVLDGACPTALRLVVDAPGHYRKMIPRVNADDKLIVTLEKSGYVEGRIVGDSANEDAGARSSIQLVYELPPGDTDYTTTDSTGRFRLTLRYPCRYFLAAENPSIPGQITSGWHEEPAREILLRPQPGRLVLRAKDSVTGESIQKFRGAVYWGEYLDEQRAKSRFQFTSRAAARDGILSLPGPREWESSTGCLRVVADGYLPRLSADLPGEVNDTVQGVVRLERGASISGRVVDAATGAAVPDAPVLCIQRKEWEEPEWHQVVAQTTTDEDGNFGLLGMGLGTFELVTRRADGMVASAQITVTDNLPQHDVKLVVPAAVTVSGKITDFVSTPGARVALVPEEKPKFPVDPRYRPYRGPASANVLGSATITADGSFEFTGCTAGSYELFLVLPVPAHRGSPLHFPLAKVWIADKDVAVTVDGTLHRPGTIAGKLDVRGLSVSWDRLAVLTTRQVDDQKYSPLSQQLDRSHWTLVGPDGEYEVTVPPGKHRLSLVDLETAVRLHWIADPIEVPPGEHKSQDLHVPLVSVAVKLVPKVDRVLADFLQIEFPDRKGLLGPYGVLPLLGVVGTTGYPGVSLVEGGRDVSLLLPEGRVKVVVHPGFNSRGRTMSRADELGATEFVAQAGKPMEIRIEVAPPLTLK